MSEQLREGYTTGSCATAAALAALTFLITGYKASKISTPLPVKGNLDIPIKTVVAENAGARGTVVKDGGDDPDATHGHDIECYVELVSKGGSGLDIELDGGKGVGRVTLEGLPVNVGEAAINPVPRKQIKRAVKDFILSHCKEFNGVIKIVVEVPKGELIAKETMNPRLGILGGISILGTQGIVRPYSHGSWKASIAQGLNVAAAAGHTEIVFTTGRRSEKFYTDHYPKTLPLCMIQAADFFNWSMSKAGSKKYKKVTWSIFIGKLVKHALGFPYTHAKDWSIDFDKLSLWCLDIGISSEICNQIKGANTAMQAMTMVPKDQLRPFIDMLVEKAIMNGRNFSGSEDMEICYTVFDFSGNIIN